MSNGSQTKVVIIGGGAAGVFTAYWLEKTAPGHFDITILEKCAEIGGHTRSQPVSIRDDVNVDAGAQFFSETSQPQYYQLLKDEGFFDNASPIKETDVGVTLWDSTQDQRLFRVPATLPDIILALLSDPVNWAIFTDLTIEAIKVVRSHNSWEQTFGDWLDEAIDVVVLENALGITDPEKEEFKADIGRPFMYQFGTVPPDQIHSLSAKFVLFYYVFSLPWGVPLSRSFGPGFLKVNTSAIGLDGILQNLLEAYSPKEVKLNTLVQSVAPQGDGYLVAASDGTTSMTFDADEVVFAVNPRQILDLLPDNEAKFDAVRSVLSGMDYLTVPVRIQRDNPDYMPGDDDEWSVANVLVESDDASGPTHYMHSFWFGPLKPEQPNANTIFKAWGSPDLVPGDTVFEFDQTHELMVGTPSFIEKRDVLRTDYEGEHNLWYAGGYVIDYDSQNACLKSAKLVGSSLILKHQVETERSEHELRALANPQELTLPFEGRPELLDVIKKELEPALRDWREKREDR